MTAEYRDPHFHVWQNVQKGNLSPPSIKKTIVQL